MQNHKNQTYNTIINTRTPGATLPNKLVNKHEKEKNTSPMLCCKPCSC